MKYIFLADDSVSKREDIYNDLLTIFPDSRILMASCGNELLFYINIQFRTFVRENLTECLIVTDMAMPQFDCTPVLADCGFRALRRLTAQGVKCPAIITSSENVDDIAIKAVYPNYLGSVTYQCGIVQVDAYKALIDKIF